MTKNEILSQLQEGKITQEEALKLLETAEEVVVTEDKRDLSWTTTKSKKGKFLVIKVVDPNKGEKVNLRLPLSLVQFGLKLGAKFDDSGSLKGIDMEEIKRLLEEEGLEKIIDVKKESGETVEITIER